MRLPPMPRFSALWREVAEKPSWPAFLSRFSHSRSQTDAYETVDPATSVVELRAPYRSAARHRLAGAALGRRPIFIRRSGAEFVVACERSSRKNLHRFPPDHGGYTPATNPAG